MNFLIFSCRGEVAQGTQFALPQVLVQVGLHKSFHVEGSLLAILFLLLFFVKKLPQVVVQVRLHKTFFLTLIFLVVGIFAVLSLASFFCSKNLKEKNKTILNVLRFSPEVKSFHFSLDWVRPLSTKFYPALQSNKWDLKCLKLATNLPQWLPLHLAAPSLLPNTSLWTSLSKSTTRRRAHRWHVYFHPCSWITLFIRAVCSLQTKVALWPSLWQCHQPRPA